MTPDSYDATGRRLVCLTCGDTRREVVWTPGPDGVPAWWSRCVYCGVLFEQTGPPPEPAPADRRPVLIDWL